MAVTTTCARCGREMPASSLFCSECGTAAPPPPLPPARPPLPPVAPVPPPLTSNATAEFTPFEITGSETSLMMPPPPPGLSPLAPAGHVAQSAGAGPADAGVFEADDESEATVVVSHPRAFLEAEGDDEATRIVTRRLELHFTTGEVVSVLGPGIVGRRPVSPTGRTLSLIRVSDPTRTVSKVHLEFGIDGRDLWIEDRGSANGTILVVAPGAEPHRLERGERAALEIGAEVRLGHQAFVVRDAR